MSVKIRRRLLNEELSNTTVKGGDIEVQRKQFDISDISSLATQMINRKKLDLRKIYTDGFAGMGIDRTHGVPLSKVRVPVTVITKDKATGEVKSEELIPAAIIQYCEMVKLKAESLDKIGYFLKYFNKPIVWTWDIETAASDGIRIGFNPVFANKLLDLGNIDAMELKRKFIEQGNGKVADKTDLQYASAKYFIFVLLHEAFHQVYRHREAAERKPETEGGKNHELANIAMDAEINRDIERLMKDTTSTAYNINFEGATEKIGGVFDRRFPRETWDDIFDQYLSGAVTPPPSAFQHTKNNTKKKAPGYDKKVNTLEPKEVRDVQLPPGPPPPPGPKKEYSDEYKQGRHDAINDVISGRKDPFKHVPRQMPTDYEKGYDDAIAEIVDGLINGIDRPKPPQGGGPQGGGDNGDDLEQIPWDVPEPIDINSGDGDGEGGDGEDGEDGEDGDGQGGDGQGGDGQDGNDQDGDGESSDGQGRDGQQGKPGKGKWKGTKKDNAPLGTDLSDKSDDYKNGYGDECERQMREMQGLSNGPVNPNESDEAKRGREQARKDIKNKMKDVEDQMDKELNKDISADEASKRYTNVEVDTATSSKFGDCDMMSKQELSELAKEAGDPYDSRDLAQSAAQRAKDYLSRYGDQIKQSFPDLKTILDDISAKLAKLQPIGGNWKAKLKKHMRDAAKGDIYFTRSKRTMAQKSRFDRYAPYKQLEDEKQEGANIFYLIDGSGSMWGAGGENIFLRIFKEILTIEKMCQVNMSARAWFATDGKLTPNDIELWDKKTSKDQIIKKLGDAGLCSGTDISKNVLAVTKMKPPYYFQTDKKHTTIMVFTDGEECGSGGFEVLRQIPTKILKDVVFVLINNRSALPGILKELQGFGGVSLNNILCICREDYKD